MYFWKHLPFGNIFKKHIKTLLKSIDKFFQQCYTCIRKEEKEMKKRQLKKSIKMSLLFTNLLINLVIVTFLDFNILVKILLIIFPIILLIDEN